MVIEQPTRVTQLALDDEAIATLGARLRGRLIQPHAANYDDARRVWNGMIDRSPALIVRCAGVADVISAVNFARSKNCWSRYAAAVTTSPATRSVTAA